MQYTEKISLLKSLHGLGEIPERQLAALAEFLKPRQFEDGGTVFKEGSIGMSLYFVSSGQVRISKSGTRNSKDLAILGPGDFFGEMALIEEESLRSASATAAGPCVLFELFRGDLDHWIKSNPQQAVKFFAELLNMQSQRLRRTSNEMTLFSDLYNILFEQPDSLKDYLAQVLDRIISYYEGGWSAAAYLSKSSKDPEVLIISRGNFKFEGAMKDPIPAQNKAVIWQDERTLSVPLPDKKRGRLIFRAQSAVNPKNRDEIDRTLVMVSQLVAGALELPRYSKS